MSALLLFAISTVSSLSSISTALPQKPNLDVILNRRTDVYIAGFFPFGKGVENSNTVGRGVMPSVKLALDHVNEHDAVLRNYRLHMWWNDTECNAAVGVKSFFDMMHSGPHKLMLFGAACTHVTDPIAKASKHWHLTQLSYADTHPMFTKEAFPNFFRIVPSENAFNAPRIRLLQHFNWTRVGTIYQNEPRYALAHNRLVAELDTAGFDIAETQSFATEVRTALTKLKEKDIRIILGNFNETWAIKIFCEAYQLEMYGRAYTWLLQGTYSEKWWLRRAPCSKKDLSTSLDTAILTDLLPLSTTGETTVSGITAKDYQIEYDRRRGIEYSRFHGYTYDGIWAMALAIQTVAQRVKLKHKEKTVQDFRYRDKEWEQLFLDALSNVSFEGVTGPVRFYDNERKASILLKQFQGDHVGEVKVGEYCAERDHLDLTIGENFKWIGKNPPKDRTLRLIEHTQVNITIYSVLVSCSILGILLATGFLAMNIHYRNQRYIKMSSPHLNNLIIIGCMLTYLSVIFLGLDSSLSSIGLSQETERGAAFPYICTARAWLLMAGFSLAFGAMFSKTWRVHSIFTDVKLNKKVIKDYQLFMVVGVLLCVDLAIMTTWQVSDPFYRATKQLEPYPHPSSEDIVIVQENEYCQSERMSIFIGIIYAYKGLLLVFGAFLAWETRHVSIPALNDSKHIGLSVYNVLIMCIMGAAIALVLTDHKDALFVLIAIFIIFCTTATLCLVFVPKLLELRRNGQPGAAPSRIRATLRPASTHECRSPGPELERRMKELRQYNNRYRRTLQAKENELQMLLSKLGEDVRSDSSTRGDSRSPATQRTRLPLPKDNISHPETSDITSVCSLSASAGAEAEYINLQNQTDRPKPSAPPEPIKEAKEPPKEPKKEQTKNVSFKNHLDYTSPPSSKPVLEKDQLAKLPYGWTAEEPSEPPKPATKTPEPAKAEAKTIPALKQSVTPTAKSEPAKVQEPMYTKAATPKVNKTPELQKKTVKTQESAPRDPRDFKTGPRSHRRMSSVSQAALLTDLMHVSVDQDDVEPPPGMERKVIGQERDPTPPVKPKQEPEDILDLDRDYSTAERKKACQRRDSEKRKKENYIVVQSDLWDTNTFQYTCQKSPPGHHHSPMQRSVSEKSRQQSSPHHHREVDSRSLERRASNASINYAGTTRGGTPEGYREAETLKMTDKLSKRRGSEFPQPVSTPPHQIQTKRRQSSAQVRSYQEEREKTDKSDTRRHDDIPRKPLMEIRPEPKEADSWRPDPDTIRVAKSQDSPAKRLRQEAEPLKRAKGVGDSPRLTQAQSQVKQVRPNHHKSSPNVASRNKSDSPNKREERKSANYSRSDSKRQDSTDQRKMYTASSESELFECAILPIFHKLLTERHKSQPHSLNLSYGVSCPNISIKCDIVEYL
ncbi:gamma-aminobutyric acid type B receptor subunit 2 isoform X3 [Hyposmocoma kahamanoa]|uniref:gamma-aminobutyric acid type B receptor subunit 2 isoform X3 n=1 Tax=Hyposmocoma kahamanoa TaxID=1477025 RepID=UPI000E6D66F9|nr:gamma-aminobutyric acid type B receptor subunit 2 isoform X3 [Hyposmocoma kahamanoa]